MKKKSTTNTEPFWEKNNQAISKKHYDSYQLDKWDSKYPPNETGSNSLKSSFLFWTWFGRRKIYC